MELTTRAILRRIRDTRPPALATKMGLARQFQTQILANQIWLADAGNQTEDVTPGSFDSALWITLNGSPTPCHPQMTFLYLRILRTK